MLVVKIRDGILVSPEQMDRMAKTFSAQAKNGVVLLPAYCELLNEVPKDTKIKVIREQSTYCKDENHADLF